MPKPHYKKIKWYKLYNKAKNKALELISQNMLDGQLMYFLLLSGCRINEALRVTPARITEIGGVNIPASKESNERNLFIPQMADYLLDCKLLGKLPFGNRTYNQSFYVISKFNLDRVIFGNENRSVNHIERYLYIWKLMDSGYSAMQIQSEIGHKVLATTQGYISRINLSS